MKKTVLTLMLLGVTGLVVYILFVRTHQQPKVVVKDEATLVATSSGDVVGFIDDYDTLAWMGIPYAAAPVGTGRWQAPHAPRRSSSVIEALAPGNVCPQFASLLSGAAEGNEQGELVGNEDCLYLNVWSPRDNGGLPVMLWIHGGGNTIGHGGSYIGAHLASDQKVVVVSVNYRLGIFGWFNHPALQQGNALDDSGNYGTLDLIRALEWTRDNIGAFGGDANNITVFGESAGAFNTLALMASPLAKGLFHRAIVQSGGFDVTSLVSAQNFEANGGHKMSSREVTSKLLLADGRVDSIDAARSLQSHMSNAAQREFLYSRTPADFFSIFDSRGFGMIDLPNNFADGTVLPDKSTEDIFSSREAHNPVPIILGTNRDEPTTFMVRDPRYVDTFLGLFSSLKDEAAYRRIVHYQARGWKARGVDQLAEFMTAAGNHNVFAYRWDWDEEPSLLGYDLSKALGAGHGLEIAFVFGEFEKGLGLGYIYPGNDAQYSLSKSMMNYWGEFAYSGDPAKGKNGTEIPWLRWGSAGKTSLILDSPADQGIFMDDEKVTYASLKSELAADRSFTDPADPCGLYVRLFAWNSGWNEAEYQSLGQGVCRSYDPDEFDRF